MIESPYERVTRTEHVDSLDEFSTVLSRLSGIHTYEFKVEVHIYRDFLSINTVFLRSNTYCLIILANWTDDEKTAFNKSFQQYLDTFKHLIDSKYHTSDHQWTLLNGIFFTATVVSTIGMQ